MNKGLALRLSIAAVIGMALVLLSISPSYVFNLSEQLVDEGSVLRLLLATVPIAVVWVATVLFRVGREPPHRGAVNAEIAKRLAEEMCSVEDCPQLEDPSPEFRDAAIALFYKKIDAPSREVAFEYWENYYLARGALQIMSVALGAALLVLVLFPHSDELAVRMLFAAILALAVWASWNLEKTWKVKTLNHARQQVLQISDDLPDVMKGARCENLNCAIANT